MFDKSPLVTPYRREMLFSTASGLLVLAAVVTPVNALPGKIISWVDR